MVAVIPPPRRLLAAAILSAIIALLAFPVARAATVEYCNKRADYPVKVTGVEITPDPVQRGTPTTFSISASTGDLITKGKVVIDVQYFIFPVHSEEIDLCKETSCPVSGDFIMAHKQTLPGITPPGSYTLTMKLLGENGRQLTCITFGFSIGFMSSVAVM